MVKVSPAPSRAPSSSSSPLPRNASLVALAAALDADASCMRATGPRYPLRRRQARRGAAEAPRNGALPSPSRCCEATILLAVPRGQAQPSRHNADLPLHVATQTENALGMRPYCEKNGIELVVTSDKEGAQSEFNKHIVDADVLITCVQLSRDLRSKSAADPRSSCPPAGPRSTPFVLLALFRALLGLPLTPSTHRATSRASSLRRPRTSSSPSPPASACVPSSLRKVLLPRAETDELPLPCRATTST